MRQWYREAVRAAFPDEPHRWLPDKPPTRSQFRYWRATRMTSDAAIELIAEAAAQQDRGYPGYKVTHLDARKKPRTRALRPIPSTDPDFAALYGVLNDTESKHHIMKSALPNKRLNVVGLPRVQLRMHAWQLAVTLGAAIAWHQRTGGDINHLFAQPPPLADAA